MSRFFRLSGAGNDFLALAEPEEAWGLERIRELCRRGLSLGADGIFHLARSGADVRMRHWNADGSLAELCVNGTRCAARLAFHLGWAEGRVRILTASGPILAEDRGELGVEIEIPAPEGVEDFVIESALAAPHEPLEAWRIRVGVPHLVVAWKRDMEAAPVATLGPVLRAHPALGPPGANVNFVSFDPPHGLSQRTFERGVEAETLACGSGVLASIAVGIAARGLELPVEALTRGGCMLEVRQAESDSGDARWRLLGDARLLAEGILHPDAGCPC